MSHAKPHLGKQRRRKLAIVVHASAVRRLDSRSLEAATCGTSQKCAKCWSLEGVDSLPAESATDVVLLVQRVIDLRVPAIRSLRKRKVVRVVVGRIRHR